MTQFVRLTLWADAFNLTESLARRFGGWPTNSRWECRNGLKCTSGYHFPAGVPPEFVDMAKGFGAFECLPPTEARAIIQPKTAAKQET